MNFIDFTLILILNPIKIELSFFLVILADSHVGFSALEDRRDVSAEVNLTGPERLRHAGIEVHLL